MPGRHGDLDCPTLTKRSFLFGLSLFVIGTIGQFVVRSLGLELPGWEMALLFGAEIVGLLIAFFSPFVFGILLPLTE
jgi:hypothetical protein